jgi:hypothetical protein
MMADPLPPALLSGAEEITAPGLPLDGATVRDFWRWAFSDLRANNVRGVFAEWLVARLLDLPLRPRESWASYDLVTPDGVTLEVKAAAYVQSWAQRAPSAIIFGGLRGQTWTPLTGFSGTRTYNADLYVFCLQTEQTAAAWNACDLAQWRFWLLPRAAVAATNSGSLGLPTVRRLTGSDGWDAATFRAQALAAIQQCVAARQVLSDSVDLPET